MKKLSGIGRYVVCALLLLGIFSLFVVRLFQWQIIDGQTYYDLSNTTSSSYIKLTATRGEILDRDGNPLAQNRTCYNIVFDDTLIDREHLNDTILELIGIMEETNTKWIDPLPIQLNSDGSYSFKEDYDSEIEFLKSSSMLHVNSYATAAECMSQLIEMFDCKDYAPEDAIKIISVRYNMKKNLFDADSPYTFAQDISADVMTVVNERTANMAGVRVDVTTIREYPDGALAPHIIGKTGPLTQEQYDFFKENDNLFDLEDNLSGYSLDDTMGQNGIEYALEDTLRGENGKLAIETDREGNLISSEVEVAPEAGNTVYLTLDSRIQAVTNVSLAKNAKAAKENAVPTDDDPKGADCEAGAAVMIDIKTGEVLAASTYPTYDLNKYISDIAYYNQLNNDKTYPMINRAFNGSFAPGSIFKPVVAAAALQEGIINSSSTVYCNHYYTYYTKDTSLAPKCMGWHYNTSIYLALQKSCNIFFYDVGRRLGITKLDAYGTLFGLGEKTGLEVSESTGVLTTPEDYERRSGQTWTDGMTLSAAIGQMDNSFTPVQLVSYCASIANGGNRMQLHLVDKVTDYTRETVVEEKGATILNEVGVDDENLEIVREGMRLVAQSGGTASDFANYGVEIGAKTGTAQTGTGNSDNVTFIAFAPYDEPEIAIAVVLEHGSNGTYSKNIARDMLNAYFYDAYVNDKGEVVLPSAADTLE